MHIGPAADSTRTPIGDNGYLVFAKLELIPHKQYQMNPMKSKNFPSRNQSPTPYPGILQKTSKSIQSPDTLWLQ